MTKKRKWSLTAGIVAVVAVAVTAGIMVMRDPLLVPGNHRIEVYAVDDAISGPAGGKSLTGMCDADTFYVEDGDQKLCLVLSGPLGKVEAERSDGKIVLSVGEAKKMATMAAQDTGGTGRTTRLVLKAGKPLALIPVSSLAADKPLTTRPLG